MKPVEVILVGIDERTGKPSRTIIDCDNPLERKRSTSGPPWERICFDESKLSWTENHVADLYKNRRTFFPWYFRT